MTRQPHRPAGQGLSVTRHAIDTLDRLAPRTEAAFLRAGEGLARGVDALGALRAVFARLQEALGPDRAADLMARIEATRAGIGVTADGLDAFLDASQRLRATIRRVEAEVAELDRVVRTIANVSVNARIQAGALVPPRPQVTAFILRLAEMADEAEAALAAVKSAMDGIGDDMQGMDSDIAGLRDEMLHDLLPALSRSAETGRALHARQGTMAEASARIADRMAEVRAAVGRLVTGLQVGDATRQRLDRVRDTLTRAEDRTATPVEAALLPLAAGLADALLSEATTEIATAMAETERLRDTSRLALEEAQKAYLAGAKPAAAAGGGDDALGQRLTRLAERMMLVTARIETILRQEARLRGIAHQVRLSGLNAVLICAKLGEDGRALRELAQWLRALTDESDRISLRLQGALDATRAELLSTGQDRIEEIRAALAERIAEGRDLAMAIGAIDAAQDGAGQECQSLGRVLAQSLGSALMELQQYRACLAEVAQAMALVRLRALLLAPPALPFAAGSEAQLLLDSLRASYTIQSERDLHDRLIPAAAQDGTPSPAPTVPDRPPAAEAQALDDIFF
ncbi:MAG: hypothetical protein RIR62_609 [Pseudomonadota bacterium]|jgi:methyl-accepting chemotaxis protein